MEPPQTTERLCLDLDGLDGLQNRAIELVTDLDRSIALAEGRIGPRPCIIDTQPVAGVEQYTFRGGKISPDPSVGMQPVAKVGQYTFRKGKISPDPSVGMQPVAGVEQYTFGGGRIGPDPSVGMQPVPKVTKLSTRRRFWRTVHRILTVDGTVGRAIEASVDRIEYVQLLVFATVLLALVDGLNYDLGGDHQAARNKYMDIPGRLLIIIVVGVVVSMATKVYRWGKYCYYPYHNHLNRTRFIYIGMAMRKYDPHTNLHEYDYNSDDDPDVATLYIRHRIKLRNQSARCMSQYRRDAQCHL